MRWIAAVGLLLSLSACGSWKGDGNDEVLPDVIGRTTGMKKWDGVPVQILGEHADENVIYNKKSIVKQFGKHL